VRFKTIAFLYDKFTQDNMCQILPEFAGFGRSYDKNILMYFVRFTVLYLLERKKTKIRNDMI